jgi:signal transduction histidine kinase/ActR/RegA family two-component response regulator
MNPTFFSKTIALGTEDIKDEQAKKGIIISNSLALTTGILALAIGTAFYFVTHSKMLLIPAVSESIAFFCIPFLNKFKKHEAAGLTLIILHCVWAIYFGALLGIIIEIRLIFLFLISATLLIYKERRPIIIGVCAATFSLIIMELNFYLNIFPPIKLGHDIQFFLRWLCILSILTLNIQAILYYKKNNKELLNQLLQHNNQLEHLVQERTAELEKANISKRIFLRQTSHEIRNPLNAIFGIAQLMQHNIKKDVEKVASLIEPLYVASFNVREILNNVLELSSIEGGKMQHVEKSCFLLRPGIIDIISFQKYVALVKSVQLDYEFDPAMPESILTDKIKLGQIISNLLSNAIKFTKHNSRILISIHKAGENWQLSITDQGMGIEAHRHESIFEVFVSEGNNFTAGTGLGLPITKHLVELLGGTISMISIINAGSTFTITLPLTGCESNQTENEQQMMLSYFSNRSVLIIDDDKMSNTILSHFLSDAGINIQTETDGRTGLSTALLQPPDLIILDTQMPGMSGIETLKHIKADNVLKHIPVIIISGDAFTETSNQFMALGANDYISKPIEYNQLCEVIGKYLGLKEEGTSVLEI